MRSDRKADKVQEARERRRAEKNSGKTTRAIKTVLAEEGKDKASVATARAIETREKGRKSPDSPAFPSYLDFVPDEDIEKYFYFEEKHPSEFSSPLDEEYKRESKVLDPKPSFDPKQSFDPKPVPIVILPSDSKPYKNISAPSPSGFSKRSHSGRKKEAPIGKTEEKSITATVKKAPSPTRSPVKTHKPAPVKTHKPARSSTLKRAIEDLKDNAAAYEKGVQKSEELRRKAIEESIQLEDLYARASLYVPNPEAYDPEILTAMLEELTV